MNEIAPIAPSRMPVAASVVREFGLGATEWRVLVDQIFPSAKSVEAVLMALSYCRARNLDIYKRPVHIVPMWSSARGEMVETVWPGIAEIRTTATRTGEYAGIDEVTWGPDVTRTFEGKDRKGNAISATVTYPEWGSVVVWRIIKGQRVPFHTKIYWTETYATSGKTDVPNDMWARRPRGQFDKCLEAAALRKAFPEEVGSMYAAEEMEGKVYEGAVSQGAVVPERTIAPPPPTASAEAKATGAEDFLTTLYATLEDCASEQTVMEAWDELDVEATLTGDEAKLQDAFDIRKARLAALDSFPGDDPLPA
jgi:phage recombination protein Bet